MATSAVAGPARVPAPPAPAGGSRRVANVDVLRAFAALGVLAIHAYALGGRNPPIRAQHAYDVPLITLATGVWLFFAVSGYVIGRPFVDRLLADRPLPGLGAYARRRAARIYPLYWIALTAVIADRWQRRHARLAVPAALPAAQQPRPRPAGGAVPGRLDADPGGAVLRLAAAAGDGGPPALAAPQPPSGWRR